MLHLREFALGAVLGPVARAVAPQRGMLLLFAGAAVAGAAVLGYMLWVAAFPRRAR